MRKKLTMLLASLFLVLGTAWAQVAYTVNATTGSGVTSNGWSKNWSYTTTAEKPAALKLLCDAANMQTRDNLLALYVGTTSPATYTLQVPNKYHIVSYSFDFVKDGEYTNDVTLTVNGKEYKPTNKTQKVEVNNVNASSTSFVFSGANKGIKVSNFVVNIVVAPIELTTDEKNPKWYTIKNVRGNAYARYDGDGEAIKLYGDIADHAFLFYFTEGTTEGTYKIHNHVNNLLCAGTNSWTETGAEWYIKTSGNSEYPGFAISTNADLTQNAAWNDFQNAHTSVAVYDGNDDGSTWDIVRYEGEVPAIQLSTEGNIVLHYIRSIRRDSYVNFAGHNVKFDEGAQGLMSYWYFVEDTEAPAIDGYIACKIFNAAHATGVEDHGKGFMGTNDYPAKTYYIGFKENDRYGYTIRRIDLANNGWHDYGGDNVGDYGLGDNGSLWRIYPAGKKGADLMSEATTAKNNALSTIALYESADYYTYSDEAIATAKTAIEAVNTAELHSAVAGITSIPAAMTTLQATEKGTAGPSVGDYVRFKNRAKGVYMAATVNDNDMIRKSDDATDLKTLWLVEAGDNGSVKLKNVGTQKYIGAIAQSADVKQKESAEASQFTFTNVADVYGAFQTTGGGDYTFANMNEWWGTFKLVGWEKNDAASQWVMTQAYPLTVVYQFEGAELTDLRVEKVVEPGTVYTIENSDAFDGKTIKSVVGATDNGAGTWAVTVNAATEVVVTLENTVEPTNLYALKSVTLGTNEDKDKEGDTYLNFSPVTTWGTTTEVSFQSAPSYLYINKENEAYVLQSLVKEEVYVGSTHGWNVTTEKSSWDISEADENGYVTISRHEGTGSDGGKNLGNDTSTKEGTGIFSNVQDACNKWQLIPAYPITIIYMYNGNEIDRVKTGVFVGESYTIDTKGQTVVSYEINKGEIVETDGVYSIPAVNGATEVIMTLKGFDKYENSMPEFTDESGTIKSNNQYLTDLALDGVKIYTGGTYPSSVEDMYVLLPEDVVSLTRGSHTFTPTFPNGKTSHILSANLWLDKDGDGSFETHLGTTGAVNGNSNNLSTITFTIPNDVVLGSTRIRFRLDSSWGIAETADAKANRMVYDIPVVIIDDLPTTNITYNFILDGNNIGEQTFSATIGAEFPVPTPTLKMSNDLLAFELPDGTVPEAGGTYDVNVSIAAADFPVPTTIANDKFAADTKWYYATLRGEYVKYNGTTLVTTSTRGIGDDEIFAITGNIKDGFQLYNKALGTGKAIYSNQPKELNNNNPTPIELTAKPTGTWSVTTNSHGGFSFAVYYNNKNYYLHEKENVLSFWGSENATGDAGSSLVFSPVYEYSILVEGLPQGATAGITFDGSAWNSDKMLAPDYIDLDRFSANDIAGYAWEYSLVERTITLTYSTVETTINPEAVVALVNRIGGAGIAEKFQFVLDPSINSKQETFVLGADGSKILIKGSTLSAITTGLGWYLNNIAHINIAWNSLNEKTVSGAAYADLSKLPLPSQTETHTSDAKYRYYLNYCTFGYSMTSWTWKRWQQEIDWMALHGINMPLQIVGLEEVWRKFLTMPKYKYTAEQAKAFVPGPAFTAWWGMNNLEGWGGTGTDGWGGVQDDAWYQRQQALATQILARQRELGMEPVLPGFSGMVPSNFASKTGVTTLNPGGWGGFTRPHIIAPGNEKFAEIAKDYYQCLEEVMGTSKYYSMDPFHEGAGHLASVEGYATIYDAMEAAQPGSQWVIQQWQWDNGNQKLSLQGVPAGKLIVLDLFSDGKPEFDAYSYNGYAPQDAVFCVIPNFGGRSGLMGRLNTIAKNYFLYKGKHATIKGIGAAPEAIEQTPVTYDLLFQLPWMNGQEPDVKAWVEDYAIARYGKDNDVVKEAWELLREGVLNYGTDKIQGPVEDVWAARPNLEAYAASSWGSTLSRGYKIPAPENTYNAERRQMLIDAVYKLIDQEDELALTDGSVYKSNYMYDLVEFGGGVMADYAHYLLLGVRDAKNAGNTALYEARRDAFLQLILDMDAFRGTNLNFRLGKWTQEARDAAKEAKTYGATTANEDWYEFNNARTIITTWGDQSQNSGLKDYSYRSWQGLLADYYYPRWKYYFDNSCTDPTNGYFFFEWNWAHGMTHKVGDTQKSTTRLAEGAKGYSYSRTPEGNTVEEAKTMLGKYIIPIKYNDGTTYYAYRTFATDLTDKVTINVAAGATIDFAAYFGITNAVGTIKGDFANGGSANMSQAVINAAEGTYTATITLTDGTELKNLTVTVEKAAINAGYYHIKYENQPLFIGYNEENDDWVGDDHKGYKILGGAYTTNTEADKVFAIVPNGNGYSIAAQGKYLKAIEFNTWRHIQFSDNKDEAGKYVFHEVADIANAFKIEGIGTNDGVDPHNNYLQVYNTNNSGRFIVGPNQESDASNFTLTPITNYTVTIPEKGYLPLCLPFNVKLPNGVVAYDINDLSKEKLALGSEGLFVQVASTNDILKAGTPVILKAASGQYTLTITMENEGAKTSATGSVLRGNYVKQTLYASSEVKRFVLNGDNFEIIRGGKEIPANSCWIEANSDNIKDDFIDLIPDYIIIGDWKFRVQETGKGLTITDCVATGSGHLVIGSKYTVNGVEKEVIAISDEFLYGNTDLTEITLPATLTSVGNTHANYMFDITYSGPDEGAGLNIGVPEDENNADDYNASVAEAEAHKGVEHNCHYTVLGASTWRMTVNVTLDENVTHFNQYGSCLLATRENTLANDYSDGSMQLYLRADKGVVLKLDEDGDTYMFNNPKIYTNGTQYTGNTFTFVLENDGAGGYMAKMIYGDGREETLEITAADDAELHDFETIWSSLGTGITVNVQFDKLTNNGLFVGCTNLKAIHVAEGNPSFSGCEHGVLYNKAKTHIIRFPEGGGYTENGHRQFETPRSVTKVYAGALHGVDAHIVFHSNPEILHVAGHEEHMIAKYHLVIDDDADVVNFNSNNLNKFETVHYNRAFSNKDVYGTIMLPFVPNEESLSKITFFEFESGDANTLTFKEVTAVQPNTPYLFTMKEDGITSLEGGVTTITAVTNYTSENTNGNWTSVGCYKTGTVITNNAGETNSYYGLNNSKQFVRVSKKINTKPYRAYYKMAPSANGEAPAAKFSLIFRDGSTQVITPSQIEGWEENVYYDLMGRRVMNPTNGVYIVNGKKVVVK